MIEKQDRRSFLKVAAATSALGAVGARPAEAASRVANVKLGDARPFSFEALKAEAQKLVKEPYRAPNVPAPEITSLIDYEKWGQITYNTDHALYADTKERFPIEFFHLGKFFKKAVHIHVVENGEAREVLYDTSYFNMPEDSIARTLPAGAGFAGFRIL
jgi:glucans biosynthesis protein